MCWFFHITQQNLTGLISIYGLLGCSTSVFATFQIGWDATPWSPSGSFYPSHLENSSRYSCLEKMNNHCTISQKVSAFWWQKLDSWIVLVGIFNIFLKVVQAELLLLTQICVYGMLEMLSFSGILLLLLPSVAYSPNFSKWSSIQILTKSNPVWLFQNQPWSASSC